MKITFWQFFKMGVAVGAGAELGKILPGVVIHLVHRYIPEEYKKESRGYYRPSQRRRQTDYTKRSSGNVTGIRIKNENEPGQSTWVEPPTKPHD